VEIVIAKKQVQEKLSHWYIHMSISTKRIQLNDAYMHQSAPKMYFQH